jgi:hypothetical protein
MAAVTTNTNIGNGDGSLILNTWSLTTADPTGDAVSSAEWADRTWQYSGTWGGATLTLQGSNDKSNWFTLDNAAGGTALTATANGGAASVELPLWVRPNLTTPGTGATVTVTALFRRAQPLRV